MARSLTEIQRKAPEDILAGLIDPESPGASAEAGMKLVNQAKRYNLNLRNYLRLAIEPRASEKKERFVDESGRFLNGYEAALMHLGLPSRDDFDRGVVLDLAADTFATYPGTKAMFPEVVNDMLQWSYRQEANIERLEPLVAQTRTIDGVEEITTVVNDEQADYQNYSPIAEGANIPIKTIRTGEKTVKFWKFGGGIRTTYEFSRRANLELLVPYMRRMAREIEISKVGRATDMLVNGDGVNPSANVTTQSSFDAAVGTSATNGKISWEHLLRWLLDCYNRGIYIDTVVGNIDAYAEWLTMFAKPSVTGDEYAQGVLARGGFQLGGVPLLSGVINFALSTTAPASKLIGFTAGETLEELKEAGSDIQESEQAIRNQTMTVVKTENSGFKLVYSDTREVYDYGN